MSFHWTNPYRLDNGDILLDQRGGRGTVCIDRDLLQVKTKVKESSDRVRV